MANLRRRIAASCLPLALAFLVSAGGCASSGSQPASESSPAASDGTHSSPPPALADSTEASGPGTVTDGSLLRPGDVVKLEIWREPDFSGEYQVDRDGMVVLPRLGERDVTGRSADELTRELMEDYRAYLRNPSMDVTILRRVNILGAVSQPGLYPVDPTVTIEDALALAGGATPQGNPEEVRLIRDGERLTTRLGPEMRLADATIRSGDQLIVPERSWFSRNTGILAATISGAVTLFVAIAVR